MKLEKNVPVNNGHLKVTMGFTDMVIGYGQTCQFAHEYVHVCTNNILSTGFVHGNICKTVQGVVGVGCPSYAHSLSLSQKQIC